MIHFSRFTKIYALISMIVIGFGLYSILQWGYIYSIDFTGGTEVRYAISGASESKLPEVLTSATIEKSLGSLSSSLESSRVRGTELTIRTATMDKEDEKQFRTSLAKETGLEITLLRFDEVGPTIAQDMIYKTLVALGVGMIIILGYIFFAFKKFTFALAAVLAMLHDVLVVAGTYSLMSHFWGAQLDTLFVTAILTTMSFSVHDTIVIFDKIREDRKHVAGKSMDELADRAVSSTMIRSLNNSLTIMFMLVALVALGGDSIRFFALALLTGTVTGAYSSPFVATPLALALERYFKKSN